MVNERETKLIESFTMVPYLTQFIYRFIFHLEPI